MGLPTSSPKTSAKKDYSMCVIIHRKPGVTIPFVKLETACHVNSEGMGIVTVDRGKLFLRKFFWEKGNDPEVLAKYLEDTNDTETFVHLRFRTRGSSDSDNVHPFTVLKQKKHGMDIQFMHNGTISDFGDDKDCDSKVFAKTLVSPLAERLMKAVGPENVLHDPIFNTLLAKYAGGNSIFLLADNLGNHTIVNRKKGTEFDGWWASNEYSFTRNYRTGGTTYSSGTYSEWKASEADHKKMYGYQAASEKSKVITLPALPPSNTTSDTETTGSKPPFNDEVPWKEDAHETAKQETKNLNFPNRETFIEMAGLHSLSEVCSLSNENIKDLVDDEPEMASLLILDLLNELYNRDQEYEDREVYERSVA